MESSVALCTLPFPLLKEGIDMFPDWLGPVPGMDYFWLLALYIPFIMIYYYYAAAEPWWKCLPIVLLLILFPKPELTVLIWDICMIFLLFGYPLGFWKISPGLACCMF
jgi:hypothetical protein